MSSDEAYRKQVIKTFFKNGMLLQMPTQNRKKDVVLQKISSRLVPDKMYTDDEIILFLQKICINPASLKADLLASRFIKTTKGLHQLVY